MFRCVRRFVVWLMVAILPVQGYAAATMIVCGPNHERMAARTGASHDHGVHAHGMHAHGMHAHGMHDHGVDDHVAHGAAAHHDAAHDHAKSASHAPASIADGTDRPINDRGDFTCSACAACCVGAALPAGDVSLDLCAPGPDTLCPSLAAPLTAVPLDGPERPPRPSSPD